MEIIKCFEYYVSFYIFRITTSIMKSQQSILLVHQMQTL